MTSCRRGRQQLVQEEELQIMEDIATRIDVDIRIIHETLRGAMHPLD